MRRHAVIATTGVVDHLGDRPFGPITLRCFDVSQATVVIHDVDGDTTVTIDGDLVVVDGPADVSTVERIGL